MKIDANYPLGGERPAADPLRVAVLGAGYVGLVTAACLAELGHQVTSVDTDPRKLATLLSGGCPIHEPDLEPLIARNRAAGRLAFAADPGDLESVRAVILAVGTPPLPESGGADLSELFEAVRRLAPRLGRHTAVIIKSTVPPGTADAVQRLLEDLRPSLKPTVVSNPEFLREGAGIADFMAPDRIVAGCATPYARWIVGQLYAPLVARGAPLLVTSRRSAELVKYGSNAFLATKISFINEMADLCEAIGADVADVAQGMGLDRRIGAEFLQAGPGYGGSCFPKDTLALLATAAEYETEMRVVSGTVAANLRRTDRITAQIAHALGGELRGKRIAVLGLTFKPDTDDVRESPALALVDRLAAAGAQVTVYDPCARDVDGVGFASDAYACALGADAIVLGTPWSEFARLDLDRLGSLAAQRLIIDLHNALAPEALVRAGFTVHGVGRALRAPERATAFTDREPGFRPDAAPLSAYVTLDCAAS